MATNRVIQLLSAWGFSDEIIGHFTAQEVEVDQFINLTEEDLKILIPNIGPRRKFQTNIKKYLDETAQQQFIENQQPQQGDLDIANIPIKKPKIDLKQQYYSDLVNEDRNTENISPTSSSASANTGYDVIFLTNDATTSAAEIKQHAATDNKYDLESILKKSEDGQLLLSLYKNEGRLNNDSRNKLAKIIVSNELSPNINNIIRSERASFLSDHVTQLFPTEDKNVWYIKNKKGESQGRGKILTKYYCTRRKLIKAGLLNVKTVADFAHAQTDNEESDDDNVNNYEECVLWLKNNCRPWQTVTEYWSLTSKKRLKTLQTNNNQSCHEYMIQFPALSDPLGYVLLEKDFEILYPGRNLKLYVAWQKISNFVTNKVTSKLKNRFDNVFTPDGAKIVTLSLMPYLFPVSTIRNGKTRNWRPSRKESEEGFLLHVNTIADLETRLQERTAKLQSFGQPSQPIAVIIGPSFDEIKQCFVIINTFRYEVETPLKAVDFVFKSCNALNIRYPLEVGQLFMFLQRAIYEFETLWDKHKNSQLTSSVLATIQEYKSLKS